MKTAALYRSRIRVVQDLPKSGYQKLGDVLEDANEDGRLSLCQIIDPKCLGGKRQAFALGLGQARPPTSNHSLVRTCQLEV